MNSTIRHTQITQHHTTPHDACTDHITPSNTTHNTEHHIIPHNTPYPHNINTHTTTHLLHTSPHNTYNSRLIMCNGMLECGVIVCVLLREGGVLVLCGGALVVTWWCGGDTCLCGGMWWWYAMICGDVWWCAVMCGDMCDLFYCDVCHHTTRHHTITHNHTTPHTTTLISPTAHTHNFHTHTHTHILTMAPEPLACPNVLQTITKLKKHERLANNPTIKQAKIIICERSHQNIHKWWKYRVHHNHPMCTSPHNISLSSPSSPSSHSSLFLSYLSVSRCGSQFHCMWPGSFVCLSLHVCVIGAQLVIRHGVGPHASCHTLS